MSKYSQFEVHVCEAILIQAKYASQAVELTTTPCAQNYSDCSGGKHNRKWASYSKPGPNERQPFVDAIHRHHCQEGNASLVAQLPTDHQTNCV